MEEPFGFIGFGTINSGIATGLLTSAEPPKQVYVHDPNPDRALLKAKEKFAEAIQIMESNQAVVDKASTVFVGLLPQHAEGVLTGLKFREEVTVVSMVAMTTHAKLLEHVHPARSLVRAVPIPPPWKRNSTIVIYPGHEGAGKLFTKLGRVIVAREEEQLTKLWALSALMGPFYAYQRAAVEWASDNGVDSELAFQYTSSILMSCANDAALKSEEFPGLKGVDALVTEQTPGGLNEQMVRELTDFGSYTQQKRSLDDVLARLEGRSQPHKKTRH
eukprot:TRINITY_DN61795_c0_g1_i1.p1 TRINITY_DN61795_c0_g1~~TRINITY_DN61795_c0_g1_i1.p1  ORF type:complete len:274 (-),score=45.78 TRINITY_DN61795_c0_g1_i1:135-956(-)